MTLIELLFLTFVIAVSYWCAKLLYPIAGVWLAFAGGIGAFLVIPVTLAAYRRYRRWAYMGDKYMPDCSCGNTEFKYQKVGDEYHLLCEKCGTRYEKRQEQVMVYERGEKKPYKRLVKHQGWI